MNRSCFHPIKIKGRSREPLELSRIRSHPDRINYFSFILGNVSRVIFLTALAEHEYIDIQSEEAYSSIEQEPQAAAKKLPPVRAHRLLWNDTHKV